MDCTAKTVELSSGSKTCYSCVSSGNSCDTAAHSACVNTCDNKYMDYCDKGGTAECVALNDCFDDCNSQHPYCSPYYSDYNDDGTTRTSSSSSSSSGGGGNECAGLSADDCYSGATDAIRALCNDCRRAGFIY